MHDAFSVEHVVDSAVRASQGRGAGRECSCHRKELCACRFSKVNTLGEGM